jgi:hypothetical protein
MELIEAHRTVMQRDAIAQIRPGGSIIGAPVVYLTAGTLAAPVMRDGDTLHAKPQVDVEGAAGTFGSATKEFPVIINNVKLITAELQTTRGTMGALLNAPEGLGGAQVARARREAARLEAHLRSGSTVVYARQGGLRERAGRAMARVDSVRSLLASNASSFGRLRRDSTLIAEVGDVRNELSIVRSLLDEPNGTAGRALHDSAMTNAMLAAEREMSLLFADIKKHPFRYLSF